MTNIHLVIIDPQFDFCDPSGALFVPGADEDSKRLGSFIDRASREIDDIHVTLDSHQRLHIAHPEFVVDAQGNHPPPFTVITYDDGKSGKYRAANPKLQGMWLGYIKALEDNGRYPYCIWPPHCLIGSPGAAIVDSIREALEDWALRRFATVDYVPKGSSWNTEHYSAVQADVPDPRDPSTQVNTRFVSVLEDADMVIWCGQAASHCVLNTYRDVADNFSDQDAVKKMVLLEDCQSPVPGFEQLAEDGVREMENRGMRVTTSDRLLQELGV